MKVMAGPRPVTAPAGPVMDGHANKYPRGKWARSALWSAAVRRRSAQALLLLSYGEAGASSCCCSARQSLIATESIVILSEAKDLLLPDGLSAKADPSLRSG